MTAVEVGPPITRTGTLTIANHMRAVVDMLEQFPTDVPTPTHWNVEDYVRTPKIAWLLFGGRHGDQKATAATIMRALGGTWDKSPGELFGFTSTRGGVRLQIMVDRTAVCERVVTGTTTETIEVPDPTVVVPTVIETRTVETFEWVCAPVLGGAA